MLTKKNIFYYYYLLKHKIAVFYYPSGRLAHTQDSLWSVKGTRILYITHYNHKANNIKIKRK
ncbi:hypothetical protein SAMN04487898_104310 [Pedobacter sp. ok626]|nr:hypothetical protein SAMN04487898_104310 [Pedobacter sp. ok626]